MAIENDDLLYVYDTSEGEGKKIKYETLKSGSGGTGEFGYWDRTGTTLSPATAGDSVGIGSFSDGSDTGAGCDIQSGGLIASQRALATAGTSDVYRGYHGNTITSSIQADGTIKIGGTLPSAPNISLNADGSIYNTKVYQLQPSSPIAANADLIYVNPSSANAANDFNFLRFTVAGSNDRCVIKKDGSATFAGAVNAGTSGVGGPSSAIVGSTSNADTTQGSIFANNGNVNGCVFVGYQGNNLNSQIFADGSATFKGLVQTRVGTFTSPTDTSYTTQLQLIKTGGSGLNSPYARFDIGRYKQDGSVNQYASLKLFVVNTASGDAGAEFLFNGDGSARFAGAVTCSGLLTDKVVKVHRTNPADAGFELRYPTDTEADRTFYVQADGSATFAGNVTGGTPVSNVVTDTGWGIFPGTSEGRPALWLKSSNAIAGKETERAINVADPNGNSLFNVKYDGSATFAGRVTVGTSSLFDYAITAYNNSATVPTIYGDQSGAGPLLDLRQANARNLLVENDGSLKINEVTTNNFNISLNGDGSATFAGTVQSARLNVYAATSVLSGYNASSTRVFFIDDAGTTQIGGGLGSTAANNTPNIELNPSGSATFAGKVTSASTEASDAGTTLATKDYVDANAGGTSGIVAFGYTEPDKGAVRNSRLSNCTVVGQGGNTGFSDARITYTGSETLTTNNSWLQPVDESSSTGTPGIQVRTRVNATTWDVTLFGDYQYPLALQRCMWQIIKI